MAMCSSSSSSGDDSPVSVALGIREEQSRGVPAQPEPATASPCSDRDVGVARQSPDRPRAGAGSVASLPPDFEVTLNAGHGEDPQSWPLWYRCWCIAVVSLCSWVATMYSTSYNASAPGLVDEFGASTTLVTLGLTTYLLGLAAASSTSSVWPPGPCSLCHVPSPGR